MKKLLVLAFTATAVASFGQVWDSGPNLGWSIPDSPAAEVSWNFTPTGVSGALTQFDISMDTSSGGVVHTWRGDLRIRVVDPGGHAVQLHFNEGGSADFISAWYADGGAADPAGVNLNSDVSSTQYAPSVGGVGGTVGGLSQSAGAWTLFAVDTAGGDTGTIGRIRVHTAGGVPEPATLTVLGIAGLAMLRRRKKA